MTTVFLSNQEVVKALEATFKDSNLEIFNSIRNQLPEAIANIPITPWSLIEKSYFVFNKQKQRKHLERFLANLPIAKNAFIDTLEDIFPPMMYLLVQRDENFISVDEWCILDALEKSTGEDFPYIKKIYILELLDCKTPSGKGTDVVKCLDEALRRSKSASIRKHRIDFFRNLTLDDEEETRYLQNVLNLIVTYD